MTTDPTTEPLRFAYWVPNVSGGLVTSTIEQRTDWSFGYNRKLARLAEQAGFDYALSQVRYTASYGAEYHALGIDEFILSGYPHLEEAYQVAEGIMPVLRARGLLAPAPSAERTMVEAR